MNEGAVSRALGVAGSPAVAEDVIVARDLLIALETDKPWHIAHVSTRGALAILRDARARGTRATCEVTPHHLLLTDEAVRELGAGAKVNPPLRAEATTRARCATPCATARSTPSRPITRRTRRQEKAGDLAQRRGRLHRVGDRGRRLRAALPDLPLLRFVALLSTNPARILGVPGGSLAVGSPADVTIFAERTWTVDPLAFASKGKSTPFAGNVFARRAIATIVGGVTSYRDASVRQ